MKKSLILLLVAVLFISKTASSCTNFLVSKGASADGSTIVTYAADSHQLYGSLYYWAARDWTPGTLLDVYEWDTGKYLGKIDQISHTYQVTGNINEHQLVIGETTYGGLEVLGSQTGAIVDYGSLIYITLQRAKNAREAIKTMAELVEKYGYASSGESFSIADGNEVWIMDLIGKGDFKTKDGKNEKGAVWVALRIPEGYVAAHANHARITTFPFQKKNKFDDPNANCFHSSDVISFAINNKLYEGPAEKFSFSDVYAPVEFSAARFAELRVWAFFNKVSSEFRNNKNNWEYATGNIKHAVTYKEGPMKPENFPTHRMPLWVKVDQKLDVHSIMNYMRDHLEGTELDMAKDAGAEPFGLPYRWRPLTWKVDDKNYLNERVTATQQTGFSFVAQSRSWLPAPIGGLFWFGVDDAASTVYTPIYCGINKIPVEFAENNGSMIAWSDNSAFWIFNMVTNWAYTRYNVIHPEIHNYQQQLEAGYIKQVKDIDEKAKTLYAENKDKAIQYVTDYSVSTASKLVADWKQFFQYLFMKYMDGNVKDAADMKLKDSGTNKGIPNVKYPGYSEEWKRNVINKTGDKLLIPGNNAH